MPGQRGRMDREALPQMKFNLGIKAPRCPLCFAWMERSFAHLRQIFIFSCHKDRISIRVDDPFVGRWEEAAATREKIPCPNPRCDETPMRYFATSTGFMKAVCPKCGAAISNAEPDRLEDNKTPENLGVLQ